MKILFALVVVISLIVIIALIVSKTKNSNSDKTENNRVPLTTVYEVISYIETNFKNLEETLWIANSFNDNVGMNMSIIVDKLLKTGYMPNGFNQKEGYREYKYKKL